MAVVLSLRTESAISAYGNKSPGIAASYHGATELSAAKPCLFDKILTCLLDIWHLSIEPSQVISRYATPLLSRRCVLRLLVEEFCRDIIGNGSLGLLVTPANPPEFRADLIEIGFGLAPSNFC